ncbi:MAG: DNA-binding protein WhiA [Peptococcaceae bacterium]|nr:DNA-binding protein WhiA [Peptococcaceae bacterium]
MSFSSQTKEELVRWPKGKECCRLAELAALINMGAEMPLGTDIPVEAGRFRCLRFSTENAGVARRVFTLAKPLLVLPPTVAVCRKMRLKKNNAYGVGLACQQGDLDRLGFVDEAGGAFAGIAPHLIKKRCDRKAYLRGAFLAVGSMSNPENSYHLEIVCRDAELAEGLAALMNGFGLKAGVTARKHVYVVYLKDSDKIAEFLALLGAHEAVLRFENIRVMKEVRNTVNRQVNCDSANLTKIVNAAIRQQEKIRLIERTIGINALPEHLQAIAQSRLAYPEATLKELGETLNPPIGKSGVSHRLKHVEEIADSLGRG